MNRKTLVRGLTTCVLFGLALTKPLAGQNRLYVQESDDKFHAVFKVNERLPYIMDNGILVPAKGRRLALKRVEEYLPVLIAIHDKDARPTDVTVSYSDSPLNRGYHFSAKFQSTDLLEDVFLVLEFTISNVGKKIFVYEVGQLDPWTSKPFSTEIALGQYMGSCQVDPHLFVQGVEVFTSEQPAARREELLDRMIAKRIAGVQEAGLKPFFGLTPDYPAALRKSGLKGEAVVTMLVTAQGTVRDPVVERASEPAFGEEALVAVRQWRFLPRVEDGRAVETKVSIPFVFDPPKPADTGKD